MRIPVTVFAAISLSISSGCSQNLSPTSPSLPTTPSRTTVPPITQTGSAPATGGVGIAEEREVPFKGRIEGTFAFTGTPPVLDVAVDANGNATHLGRFTLRFEHHVDVSGATGTAVFIAANGDRLLTTLTEGVATPQDTPGVLLIDEAFTITGGTGRFASATGTFTLERLAALTGSNTGVTSGSFEGTISWH